MTISLIILVISLFDSSFPLNFFVIIWVILGFFASSTSIICPSAKFSASFTSVVSTASPSFAILREVFTSAIIIFDLCFITTRLFTSAPIFFASFSLSITIGLPADHFL